MIPDPSAKRTSDLDSRLTYVSPMVGRHSAKVKIAGSNPVRKPKDSLHNFRSSRFFRRVAVSARTDG